MWEKIFNLAISNGIWAVLFLGLLIFQLNDSKKRETKYQQTIETLGKSLEIVNDVKADVEDIKHRIDDIAMGKRVKKKNTSAEGTDEITE